MSDNIIKLKIKVDDNLKFVEMNADELKDALGRVKTEADKLNSDLINSNQIAQAFEQVGAAVRGLQSVMHDLTDAYAVQSAAEARLEQVMRNTMDASEAEIQSIKDLAAAQQQLGIVGDEVQLSGAQKLATYLSKKESLEALIPVMNDMIAQQYSYNASAESAVAIASMMGKVLDGQVGALSRYGYTFTEAQEQILKFGTEEERAATLAEVVEQSVGGMNEALAATPYGKIVQANNAFGDLKETLGRIAAPAMTAVDSIARITIAIAGVGKGVATIKSLTAAVKTMTSATRAATTAQNALNSAMKKNVFIAIASAVAVLAAVLIEMARANKTAAQAAEEFAEATRASRQAFEDETNELQQLIAKLQDETASRLEHIEAIETLKAKYPDLVKMYIDEQGRITDLISLQKELNRLRTAESYQTEEDRLDEYKSKLADFQKMDYWNQQGTSWAPGLLNTPIKDLEADRKWWETDERFVKRSINLWEKRVAAQQRVVDANRRTQWLARLDDTPLDQLRAMAAEYDNYEKRFGEMGEADRRALADITAAINKKAAAEQGAAAWQTISYANLGKAINDQKRKVEGLIGVDDEAAKAEKATLDAMTARYNALARAYGLAANQSRNAAQNAQDVAARAQVEITPMLKPIEPGQLQPIIQTLGMYDRQLQSLQQQRLNASKEQLPAIDTEIARVRRLRDEFEGVTAEDRELAATPMPKFSDAWGGIKGIGNSIRDITNALKEENDAWTKLTVTIDGFIGIVQGLQAIVKVIDGISSATKTMAAVNSAASAQNVSSNAAETTSNISKAASGAAGSVSSIPVIGPALAIAAVAAVLASLANLPKFAAGGLVYGPTLGLMGEYGGASSNPEVIAPLSRLRSLIGGERGVNEVRFRIEGRELVGIARKQNKIDRRTM